MLWKDICWAPMFFKFYFQGESVSLTFKMSIQRKCAKTLHRNLQAEPSDTGKINQPAQG